MKTLYLWLNLGSFIVPFLFSFHPKIQFYKKWKSLFVGILAMMAIFIPWDILFTHRGFWGFNPEYLTGWYLFNLPVEEWLFFICIPYACIFTHYAVTTLAPRFSMRLKSFQIVYFILVTSLIVTLWYQYDHWYTLVNFIYALLILGVGYNFFRTTLPAFFTTYIIILIPFFLVNGVLTGSWIEAPVVWYNNEENLGIRLGTIPIEDTIYNLGMLLTVFLVTEKLEQKKITHD
ncbi:MAG: lycopene cyclase [Alteromonas sp.]|nr:lycopene cyclase [Alteromonas sp.]MAY23104.1 lycopene cyclase [Flavobacteriaceae bacterium]|tara:strand:- start:181071 stop:181766 length:696 start_codon:yes stop_codon:yes gene_type:complete